MKTPEQLINNIIGQLSGISKMIKEEKDCLSVITQMKAVKSALNSYMNRYIEDNFSCCMDAHKSPSKTEKMKKLLIELTKNN
jgi:DNA-binding FrmR family transcriptional regulator